MNRIAIRMQGVSVVGCDTLGSDSTRIKPNPKPGNNTGGLRFRVSDFFGKLRRSGARALGLSIGIEARVCSLGCKLVFQVLALDVAVDPPSRFVGF